MPDASKQQGHLVELAEGWSLWKAICLRGAGFPVHWLDAFAAREAAAAADDLLDLEMQAEAVRDAALQVYRDATETLTPEARRHCRRAIRHLGKGRVPEALAEAPETAAAAAAVARATADRDAARARLEAGFAEGQRRVSVELQKFCRDPVFREALIWQNRHALRDGVDILAAMDAEVRNKKRRRYETLVYSYGQRYCAKNDTIGFFGPVTWASFTEEGPTITAEPGPSLLAERRAFFEYWAVDALTEVLSRDRQLLPWFPPRLNPRLRVAEGRLYLPDQQARDLSPTVAALLAACDGQTPAIDIAARLAGEAGVAYGAPEEVLRVLADFTRRRILLWNAHVPIVPRADEALCRLLERIRDPALRQRALAPVRALQDGGAAVVAARGDPAALDSAMEKLERTFKRVTGTGPSRHAGTTYGGRTLLYEDCLRDIEVTLGPEIRRRMGPTFALLLRGAHWYLHHIGTAFTAYLEQVHARFARNAGEAAVPFEAMVMRNPEVWRAGAAIIDAAVKEHAGRWAPILAFVPGERRLDLRSDDIRARVREAFPDVPLHWPIAKYHSPDLMIAAGSADAIRRGDFQLVLGEFNAGINRLALPTLASLYPDPQDITRFLEQDMRRRRVMLAAHRHSKGHRVVFDSVSPKDFHLLTSDTPTWRAGSQALPVGELVVEKTPTGLIVRTRDGKRRFPIQDLFSMILGRGYWEQISLLPPMAQRPRVAIDGLVVAREQWTLPCGELDFAGLSSEEARFLAARRLLREKGLPRWCFARVPFERKPYYVDFESPLSVDALAKVIRGGAEQDPRTPVTLSEMLPTPEQCWLSDAEGNRYTSELRLAAVSAQTWQPSG